MSLAKRLTRYPKNRRKRPAIVQCRDLGHDWDIRPVRHIVLPGRSTCARCGATCDVDADGRRRYTYPPEPKGAQ